MNTTNPAFSHRTSVDGEQEGRLSETGSEPVSDEVDIRAFLLDETSPDLERLHNLIMMC